MQLLSGNKESDDFPEFALMVRRARSVLTPDFLERFDAHKTTDVKSDVGPISLEYLGDLTHEFPFSTLDAD